MASHELNTPIASLQMAIDAQEEGALAGAPADSLARLRRLPPAS